MDVRIGDTLLMKKPIPAAARVSRAGSRLDFRIRCRLRPRGAGSRLKINGTTKKISARRDDANRRRFVCSTTHGGAERYEEISGRLTEPGTVDDKALYRS
jgi:hypothetical protein